MSTIEEGNTHLLLVGTVAKTAARALGLVAASNTLLNVATATAIANVVLKAIGRAVRAFLLVDLVGTVAKTAARALGLVAASNTLLNVATATAITNVVLKAIFGAVRAFLLLDLR
jgi:hypothetical protein